MFSQHLPRSAPTPISLPSTSLLRSAALCCLSCFPYWAGSGLDSACFLPTGDKLPCLLHSLCPCSPSHSSRALPSAGYGSAPGQPSACGAPEPCLQLSCLGRALALLHWGRGQVCDCSLSCSLWLLTRPSCPRDLRCVLSPDFPLWKMGAVVLRASSGSFFGAWQRSHLAERRLLPG